MSRKGLNDAIHGDRANIRGYQVKKDLWYKDWDETAPTTTTAKGGKGWSLITSKPKPDQMTGHSCYLKHPALKLPGSDLVVYGGSCISPAVKDADVYIGFDDSMTFTPNRFPWNPGEEVLFGVSDMGIPANVGEYDKLVDWTVEQLLVGKRVHCGCIGGHGRTGMFFAALVAKFGELDAIFYVRKHYCHKAVESSQQVKFLADHYGIKPVLGTKEGLHNHHDGKFQSSGIQQYNCLPDNGCIWSRFNT